MASHAVARVTTVLAVSEMTAPRAVLPRAVLSMAVVSMAVVSRVTPGVTEQDGWTGASGSAEYS